MKTRLERYHQFIEKEFINGLARVDEYSIAEISNELRLKMSSGAFKRIVFTGMGCSAVVSDMIKGFFIDQKIPLWVEVLNDYDLSYLIDESVIKDESTLFIISSYSGNSNEPLLAYESIKRLTSSIVFLTSGGKLGDVAMRDKVSVIRWQLTKADREYPLINAPQFFTILLSVFHELGMIPSDYLPEIKEMANYLRAEFTNDRTESIKKEAEKFNDRNIVMLASPRWDGALLKLLRMHFNEIAMAPAHRNTFHEFTHSEIASFTDPKQKSIFLIFEDEKDNEFMKKQLSVFLNIIGEEVTQNENLEVSLITLDQDNYLKKIFYALLYINYLTYFLGLHYDTHSRDLISKAAGNSWYSSDTIEGELKVLAR